MHVVYILRCADGALYVGETADLPARLRRHLDGCACAFTASRRPVMLAYSEPHPTRASDPDARATIEEVDARQEGGAHRGRPAPAEAAVVPVVLEVVEHGTRSITFHSTAVRIITLNTVSTLLTVFGDLATIADFSC